MVALNVQQILYVCWSEESTTVMIAKFDATLWVMITDEIEQLYGKSNQKRPTKISDNVKEIRDRLKHYNSNSVEFLCKVSSVKGSNQSMAKTYISTPYLYPLNGPPVQVKHTDVVFTETTSL